MAYYAVSVLFVNWYYIVYQSSYLPVTIGYSYDP